MQNICGSCGEKGMWCVPHWIAWILTIVGGLNWGLVGAAQFNLVDAIFGEGSAVSTVVYILVGLSAIMLIFGCRCKKCCPKPVTSQPTQPVK